MEHNWSAKWINPERTIPDKDGDRPESDRRVSARK